MSNDIISTKIYDKRDDFDADIINFRFGMAMFLLVRPISRFVLPEHLVKSVTLIIDIIEIIIT